MILSEAERLEWLRLIRSENVGPKTFYALLDRFGTPKRALERLPELARKGGKRAIKVASLRDCEKEFLAIEKFGARLVAKGEPDYPPLLAQIDDAPPMLTVKGAAGLGTRHGVAIVGGRNASLNGATFARAIASEIGAHEVSIVSGLARGIDRAAHEGSIATGTVAVVAGGIDQLYPQENADIFYDIAERGLIISEIRFGERPQARHFPRRNRIVSGMCLGTLVVEATLRSGSLITARLAAEQGREVFAVPGSPLEARAKGTNQLIRSGAHLVETVDDVIEVLAPLLHRPLSEPSRDYRPAPALIPDEPDGSELDRVRPLVMDALGPTPCDIDALTRMAQTGASTISIVLLELELAGKLVREPGNRVALISGSES